MINLDFSDGRVYPVRIKTNQNITLENYWAVGAELTKDMANPNRVILQIYLNPRDILFAEAPREEIITD